MANYRHPSKKASETVTFRLTVEEKERLDQLAELADESKTDLIRRLLAEEAERKGLKTEASLTGQLSPRRTSQTGPTRQRGPTRPTVQPSLSQTLSNDDDIKTFGDLVEKFRDSFRDRAEGTRRELDDTLRFLTGVDSDYPPLFQLEMPIEELTSERLAEVRRSISDMDTRVAKKNLHLTYLRMMLHFAVKKSQGLSINPATELASFTVSELPKAWPGRHR